MANTSRKIVVIGGGVTGLGIGYHLAKLSETDVLLIERHKLTSGTSWHAAGIVGPLRASKNMTRLASYATELFPKLEAETGQSSGYLKTSGYWLARSKERMHELKRISAIGEMTNIAARIVSAEEISSAETYLFTEDLAGGLYVEDDAQANPVDICMAYAKGMRKAGIEIREGIACTSIKTANGRVRAVGLSDGSIVNCEVVVNCAGAWARQIGELANVPVPLQAAKHMYVVTEPMIDLPSPLPILRDLDSGIYLKSDAGKILLGGFEYNAKPWNASGVDGNIPFVELPEDWDQFLPFMEAGLHRLPALEHAGIQHFMNGPETFTPDSKQLLGESPFLSGFYIAAGMNSVGMMSSAGIGKAMAEWIVADEAPFDLWEVDIARFGHKHSKQSYLTERMEESVGDVFAMHWPLKQMKAGRDLYRTPLHKMFDQRGAVFGAIAGWERPLWFSRSFDDDKFDYSYGNQWWWPYAERECQALVNDVVLFELSPFTKINVSGDDALTFLQMLCANNVDVENGKTIYGQLLNHGGGIEADVTVTRFSGTRFRVTSGAATRWRDLAWLRRQRECLNLNVDIEDVTESEAVVGLMGLKSRNVLQTLTDSDLSNNQFPFATTKELMIANYRVRATRLSFVGELGYELSIPVENAEVVFQLLYSAGEPFELSWAGHLCLEGCRLEKGYRHWGHEIGPDDTPLEAGLGFAVDWDKPDGFIGRGALLKQKENGLSKRLLLFKLEGPQDFHPLVLHDEPVYRKGKLAGCTTSGGRGFRTQTTLCFAYVRCEPAETLKDLVQNEYEIGVEGQRYKIVPLLKPLYDPFGEKMRG